MPRIYKIKPVRERFLAKIVVDLDGPRPIDDAPCWTWISYIGTHGYGVMGEKENLELAHRIAWKLWFGNLPAVDDQERRLDIDHLCRNHACVNPAHLELVTHQENIKRGIRNTQLIAEQSRQQWANPAWKAKQIKLASQARSASCHARNVERRKVAEQLREAGMNQTEIGKQLGISQALVSLILNNPKYTIMPEKIPKH